MSESGSVEGSQRSWIAEGDKLPSRSGRVSLRLVKGSPNDAPKDNSCAVVTIGSHSCRIGGAHAKPETLPTCIAYPRDGLSQSMIQHGKLIGEQALKHRGTCDLYRPVAAYGVYPHDFDGPVNAGDLQQIKRARREYLTELLRRAQALTGAAKVMIGVPAALDSELSKEVSAIASSLFGSVVLVPLAFAAAYETIMKFGSAMVVDIGATSTSISVFQNGEINPKHFESIPLGGDRIDQVLLALLTQKCKGATIKSAYVQRLKEESAFVVNTESAIEIYLPVTGRPTEFNVTNEVCAACRSILSPLKDAYVKIAKKYEFDEDELVLQRVVLCGGGSNIRDIPDAIKTLFESTFKGNRTVNVTRTSLGTFGGCQAIAQSLQAEHWGEVAKLA